VITQISPPTLPNGTTATFTVTGSSTGFVAGSTTVIAVPGLTVGAGTVTSLSTLTLELTGNSDSPPQPVSIWVATGCQQAVLPNALTIQ
jgi:hypothetical protein